MSNFTEQFGKFIDVCVSRHYKALICIFFNNEHKVMIEKLPKLIIWDVL